VPLSFAGGWEEKTRRRGSAGGGEGTAVAERANGGGEGVMAGC
jgi:hypothetical protein